MQKIPVVLAEPDMVLEKPILRDNGMVLVGGGTVLTASLIGRLDNMGIKSIVVQGSPLDLGGPDSSPSARAARVDHLFRKFGDNKFMNEIKEVIKGYFGRKQAEAELRAKAEEAEAEEQEEN